MTIGILEGVSKVLHYYVHNKTCEDSEKTPQIAQITPTDPRSKGCTKKHSKDTPVERLETKKTLHSIFEGHPEDPKVLVGGSPGGGSSVGRWEFGGEVGVR